MKRVVALLTGTMLLVALAGFAQASKSKDQKSKAPATHSISGVVSSVEGDKLMVTHKVSGKDETATFTLGSQVNNKDQIKTGEKVTVHYAVENGQNTASSVTVSSGAPKSKK